MTSRRAVRVLTAVKAGAVAALLVLTVVGELHGLPDTPVGADAAPVETMTYEQVLSAAISGHHCSISGLAHGRIPSSALVRTPAGHLRQVSFDRGWATYEGRRPGTLVAVCTDPLEPRTLGSRIRGD